MGIFSRVRLLIGIIFIIGMVAALFFYLNYSMSNIVSQSAVLESDTYAVSTEYGGVIEKQYVEIGSKIKKGDPLFELKSSSLADALRSKQVDATALLFSLTPTGNILITANNNGTVREINFLTGAFVPSNGQIALIDIADSQYVTTRYLLRAPDYARINRSNPVSVTLPDNTRLEAKVFDITLQKDGEKVYTIVKARFDDNAKIPATFSSGTPVSASWQLEKSDWYQAVIDVLKGLIEPTTQSR
ncbi:MAG: Biotin/lipoyl attachment protein [Candidatus Saccharibacteria bacterium]|nr:Biotin/lipoyl attachment protein [Candidatus Saccharibacteria bacterium]